jgi:hypothetical protein
MLARRMCHSVELCAQGCAAVCRAKAVMRQGVTRPAARCARRADTRRHSACPEACARAPRWRVRASQLCVLQRACVARVC